MIPSSPNWEKTWNSTSRSDSIESRLARRWASSRPRSKADLSESSRRPRNFSIEPRILLNKAPIPFPACLQRQRIAEGHGRMPPAPPARRHPRLEFEPIPSRDATLLMKLLLVGFERRRSMGYPHLAQVAAALFEHGADYCLFRERGYLDAGTAGWPSRLRRSTRSLARVAVDSMRLMRARITGNYDLVIACDNMAFVVASMLFPRVVLWSFDFMTADPERPSAAGQRMSSSRVGSMLRRNRRLIIQDRDRLELFRKTFLGTSAAMELDVFLLPVSLLRSPARSRRTPQARPTLLQLGGISRTRSHSDLLLDD